MENEIRYSEIMSLGLKAKKQLDDVYFNHYGFDFEIITKKLAKNISLDWDKLTRKCKMIRINKKGDIKASVVIEELQDVKILINFFKNK